MRLVERQVRRLSGSRHIEENRLAQRLEPLRNRFQLLDAFRRIRIEPVDARRRVGLEAIKRVGKPVDGDRVGTRHDEEIGILARGDHCTQLHDHLVPGH